MIPQVDVVESRNPTAPAEKRADGWYRDRWLLVVVAASVALGALLVFTVRPGQPYDEPAHWGNVVYYGRHLRLPEMGEADATYEAQMGPVYYGAAAVISSVAGGTGSHGAFLAVRIAGLAAIAAAAVLTYLLAMELRPGRPVGARVAAAIVGLCPGLQAAGASVQNDYLAIVLATASVLFAARAIKREDHRATVWLLVGAVGGLAALTKLFAGAVLPALLLACILSADRRRLARPAMLATVAFGLATGWWFLRNQVVYGDPTARGGLDRIGLSFPHLPFHGAGSIASWARSMVSAVWAPTEYYRNVFDAPVWVKAGALGAAAVAVAVGLACFTRRPRSPEPSSNERLVQRFVAGFVILTFVSYAATTWLWTGLGVRLAFAAVPSGVALLVSTAGDRISNRWVLSGSAALTLGYTTLVVIWIASVNRSVGVQPYWIPF